LSALRHQDGSRALQLQVELHSNDMAAKAPARVNLQDDPQFFMFEGITAQENEYLQRRANAAVAQLFRRRVKHPIELLSDFRMALRREGFVRIRTKLCCDSISFQATLSKKLEARLRTSKYLKDHDLLYGVVTGAARRAGLDPRLEDIGARLEGSRVEGYVHPVPFIFEPGRQAWRRSPLASCTTWAMS
jgi:hypothetical protein